ncbi:protein kinase [Streptomyces glaucescens]
MAPEARSGTFDHRSDLYSLGCVLYELVTGRRPFDGTSWRLVHQHLNEEPPPLHTPRSDASLELERFVSLFCPRTPHGGWRVARSGTSSKRFTTVTPGAAAQPRL